MLATSAAGHKNKQVVSLNLTEVKPKQSQVRKLFSEIDSLALSILQEGQIQPIVVSPKNGDGYHVIQQGERRWRACQQAGLAEVDVIINDKKRSDLDEIAGELIENIQREALSPMEIASAMRCFVDEGWQQKEIAKRLGKTGSFVSTHLSLLKLPDCVAELYWADITHDIETLNNLRLLFELAPERGQSVVQAALQHGISRQRSREQLNEVKQWLEKGKGSNRSIGREQVSSLNKQSAPAVPAITAIEQHEDDSHFTPHPASTTLVHHREEGDTTLLQEDTTATADGWRAVDARKVSIFVKVLCEADFQHGIMMMDRVDSDPEFVWVRIMQGGQERSARVPVADIELVRVVAAV